MLDTELCALVVHDMPSVLVPGPGKTKRRQLSETGLAETIRYYEPDICWIERVHSMPKQGVASSFSFGLSYGLARGVIAALGVPFHLITPNEWKRSFRLGPDKDEARLIAGRMYPKQAGLFARSRDHGRAEAALLALFGAQQLQ